MFCIFNDFLSISNVKVARYARCCNFFMCNLSISGVFASVSLSIMRAKRLPMPGPPNGRGPSTLPGEGDLVLDGQIDAQFFAARSFHPSWSFYIGWVGVSTCLLSSLCVYTLSKLMRYPPFLKVS